MAMNYSAIRLFVIAVVLRVSGACELYEYGIGIDANDVVYQYPTWSYEYVPIATYSLESFCSTGDLFVELDNETTYNMGPSILKQQASALVYVPSPNPLVGSYFDWSICEPLTVPTQAAATVLSSECEGQYYCDTMSPPSGQPQLLMVTSSSPPVLMLAHVNFAGTTIRSRENLPFGTDIMVVLYYSDINTGVVFPCTSPVVVAPSLNWSQQNLAPASSCIPSNITTCNSAPAAGSSIASMLLNNPCYWNPGLSPTPPGVYYSISNCPNYVAPHSTSDEPQPDEPAQTPSQKKETPALEKLSVRALIASSAAIACIIVAIVVGVVLYRRKNRNKNAVADSNGQKSTEGTLGKNDVVLLVNSQM